MRNGERSGKDWKKVTKRENKEWNKEKMSIVKNSEEGEINMFMHNIFMDLMVLSYMKEINLKKNKEWERKINKQEENRSKKCEMKWENGKKKNLKRIKKEKR